MNRKKDIITEQLEDGVYVSYNEVSNGFGGFHPVNIFFHNDKKKIHRRITTHKGFFVNYPGHKKGKAEEDLKMAFIPATRFVADISYLHDGIYLFSWMVQPDGRYWEDGDGFGMTSDDEIWLYALMNEKGRFTTPFFDKYDERYKNPQANGNGRIKCGIVLFLADQLKALLKEVHDSF